MAKLTNIVKLFDDSRLVVAGLKSFVFDDMSAMNADREKDFPALLLKPPASSNASADMSMKDWKIDIFAFDIWNPNKDSETRKLQDVWQALEDLLRSVVKEVTKDRKQYGLVNPEKDPEFSYGYPMHNDKLVGVRCQFTFRAWFECNPSP